MEADGTLSIDTTDTSPDESSINDFKPDDSPVYVTPEGEGFKETTTEYESTTGEHPGNSTNEDFIESDSVKDDSSEVSESPLATSSNAEDLKDLGEELITEQLTEPDNLFFTKNFTDYTVVEGLLLLIFIILLFRFCLDLMFKLLHWRMF